MSVSKPVSKRPRTVPQLDVTPVTRSATTTLSSMQEEEEAKNLPTTTHQSEAQTKETKRMTHPKGHRVRELKEVWDTMDKQAFLHLTDTSALDDVLVQPQSCEEGRGSIITVNLIEIVSAPHIKKREAKCKMSTDDLLKMLYMADMLQQRFISYDVLSFEDWLNEKTADCVKAKGVDEGTNRALLCNFILTEDTKFSFYPTLFKTNFGIFFRKICYHSYKDGTKEEEKMDNPATIKCCATKGKFEYVIETRLIPLPLNWFDSFADAELI